MSRLEDQKQKMGTPVVADPLPDTKTEGDSKDTDKDDAKSGRIRR